MFMTMNKYNITKLISKARKKVNYKNIIFRNMGGYALMVAFLKLVTLFLVPYHSIVLTPLIPILTMTIAECMVNTIQQKRANRKLIELSIALRKSGIPASRLKLCKSSIGALAPKEIMSKNGCVIENSTVTIFEDRLGKIRALKQVRYELSKYQQEETSKCEYKDYTTIIENENAIENLSKSLVRR